MLCGLLAEQADATASKAVSSSGFESLGAHQWCRQGSVSESDRLRCIQIGCELVTRGDVVEMGDTLVLETSAFARESSNLSIPTKDLWRRGRVVYSTALLTRSAFERHHPFESDRLRQHCMQQPLAVRSQRRCRDVRVCLAGRVSGTVSHLVGGEAHVARRVQVQVLLLPPG